MKANHIKWIAGTVTMLFLLIGTSFADSKRDRRPNGHAGQQVAQQHRPTPAAPGAYHQNDRHKPQLQYRQPKPDCRPYQAQHYNQRDHHKPNYAQGHHPNYQRPATATIRLNPGRVLLSALFANPFLLLDAD